MQIDDNHEIERPSRRRPIEEVPLLPFDLDSGGLRLGLAVGEADRRPVDRCRAPALLRQPDCVGAATRCQLEGRTGHKTCHSRDERRVRALSFEIPALVPFVPIESTLICRHDYALTRGRVVRAQALVPPLTETAPSKPWSSRKLVAPRLRLPLSQITAYGLSCLSCGGRTGRLFRGTLTAPGTRPRLNSQSSRTSRTRTLPLCIRASSSSTPISGVLRCEKKRISAPLVELGQAAAAAAG